MMRKGGIQGMEYTEDLRPGIEASMDTGYVVRTTRKHRLPVPM